MFVVDVRTLPAEVRTFAAEVRMFVVDVRTIAVEVRTFAVEVRTFVVLYGDTRDLQGHHTLGFITYNGTWINVNRRGFRLQFVLKICYDLNMLLLEYVLSAVLCLQRVSWV